MLWEKHSELLQMLVQRVSPDLVEEGDGVVVDAILAIDTERISLKPIYRSALQVRAAAAIYNIVRFVFFQRWPQGK